MSRSKVLVGGALVVIVALQAGVAFAKPLTPKQWKKQGNAICTATNAKIAAIEGDVFAGTSDDAEPTDEQIQAFVVEFVPVIDDAVSEIVALDEPVKLRKGVKQFAAAVEDTLTTIQADPSAAFLGDEDPFAKANKVARKLGLTVCANGT